MRDGARLQAAIEVLDQVVAAAAGNGAAADVLVRRYFAERRYAGKGDRAAVRDLVYEAIRFAADRPVSGRAALLGWLEARAADRLLLFDGSRHAPAPVEPDEPRAHFGLVPHWLIPAFVERFGPAWAAEAEALLARAPLDLRWNPLRAPDSAPVLAALPGARPIAGLPFGLRLEDPIPLEHHPLWRAGAIEIQDAASQWCAAAAGVRPGMTVVDLCAGAGGKTLALAATMDGRGTIIACDVDRARLAAMAPRLARSGAEAIVEARLLDPEQERRALSDLARRADLVLVDAPCSGTGTWRRNPELRWRLTPALLNRLGATQNHLLDVAAELVAPAGRIVYAVCSVLDAEGPDAADAAARRHRLAIVQQRRFSPLHDGCDGFFFAHLAAAA